jgi:hypothetical protein
MEIQQYYLQNAAAAGKAKKGSRKKKKDEPLSPPPKDSVETGSKATRKVDIRDIAGSMLHDIYAPPLMKEWCFTASESISSEPALSRAPMGQSMLRVTTGDSMP